MKRIIWITLAFSIFLFCGTQPAHAAGSPIITGEDVYTKAGGSVDYSVSISQNTGLCAFIIYVDCDPALFTLDYDDASAAYQVTCGEMLRSGVMSCNQNGTRGWAVSWYLSNGSVARDGTLFTLRFHLAETAPAGEYPIKLRYSAKDTLNGSMAPLTMQCVSGSVTVASDSGCFAVESRAVTPGETFRLRVTTEASPGISSYMVYLLFDSSVFSCIYDDAAQSNRIFQGDLGVDGTILCSDYNDRGCRVVWYAPTETFRAGTLFELPLKVADDASGGDYTIQLFVSAADVTNIAGERIPVTAVNGTLTVAGFSWGDVTSGQTGRIFRVSTTPHSDTAVYLVAAAYTGSKAEAIRMQLLDPAAPACSFVFDLNWLRRADGRVKLYALDAATLRPVSEVYWIIGKEQG